MKLWSLFLRQVGQLAVQPCVHPLLILHNHACIHCSCCTSLHASIALFNPRTSISIQKRPFCSGNLNSETPGDSESTLLRWGHVLARAAQPCMHALLTLHKVHQV